MKPCVDCILRTERISWNENMRKHLERLNALCSCRVVPNKIRFLPHKQYMKLGSEPIPASLLALEPNLRSVNA